MIGFLLLGGAAFKPLNPGDGIETFIPSGAMAGAWPFKPLNPGDGIETVDCRSRNRLKITLSNL